MKSSEYFNLDTLLNQDDFELIDVVSKKTRLIKHCLEKAEEYHKFINRPIIPEDKVDISVLLINYDF